MADWIFLKVPFPPTVNTYYRTVRNRPIISKRGREYREAIVSNFDCRDQPAMSGRIELEIELWPPDRRKRDIDNYCKGLLDALTHAGMWKDDSQIDKLTIIRGEVDTSGGHAMLSIRELGNADALDDT